MNPLTARTTLSSLLLATALTPCLGAQDVPDAPAKDVKATEKVKAAAKPATEDDQRTARQKQLRDKQRALAHLVTEVQIATIGRRVAAMAATAELQEAKRKLADAAAAVKLFDEQQKPREIEEHKIRLDRRKHAADHAKDEFNELTAMYEADEFAKATKELVLKRGRRSMEIAARELEVEQQKYTEFVEHTLPQRRAELEAKHRAAQLAVTKAELLLEKAKLEAALAETKEKEKRADLVEEIAKLAAEPAEEKK
ncbi:MAG: hypothetical protein KAI24_08430 [Planctomycetes bacterium]|nr:hypothetical protein [Planctomycetota bacterium]